MTRFGPRFAGALALTIALVLLGTIGFARLPGWSVSDGFYMTMITITSVGYGEVRRWTKADACSRACFSSAASPLSGSGSR